MMESPDAEGVGSPGTVLAKQGVRQFRRWIDRFIDWVAKLLGS